MVSQKGRTETVDRVLQDLDRQLSSLILTKGENIMKKSIIIAAILLVASMTASILLSCVTPPIKSNAADGEKFETTKAPENDPDTDIGSSDITTDVPDNRDEVKELKVERNEAGTIIYCEFPTTDPDWTLTYSDMELVLSNGEKTFVYVDYRGEDYVKTMNYGLDFFPTFGTESARAIISEDDSHAIIIIKNSPMVVDQPDFERAVVVELNKGCIVRNHWPSWGDIFVANGYEYDSDILGDYESDGYTHPEYSITLSGEFVDGRAVLTQRLTTDDGKIDLSQTLEPFYDIDPAFESLPCLAVEKDYMTAFVRGDSKKLEELLYHKDEGVFSAYETLKFSDYKATVSEDGTVILTVDVAESGINAISPGRHVYTVSEGMSGVYMIDMGRSYSYNSTDAHPVKQFLRTWFSSILYDYTVHDAAYYVEKMGAYTASTYLYDFLGGYLMNYSDPSTKITGDELKSAAEKIFGLTDHSGLNRVYDIDEEGFAIYNFGHGGSSYYYEFVEVTDTTATVRFYADHNYTIESDLIKYVFEVDEDTGWLIPVSAEILEEGEYTPGHHSV